MSWSHYKKRYPYGELSIDTLMKLPVEPTIELVLTTLSSRSLTSTIRCRSFCRRQDHKRLGCSWCKVQLVQFSSWLIRICLLRVIDSTYHSSQSAKWSVLFLSFEAWMYHCHESQFHLHYFGSVMTHQCWFAAHHLGLVEDLWCGSITLGHAYLMPTTTFIVDECFQVRENDGRINRFINRFIFSKI